jgi:mannosyltransferase
VAEHPAATASSAAPSQHLTRHEWLILAGLTIASAAACLFDLGSRSLWNDEFHSVLIALHHGTSLWSAVRADGGNMAVYYLVLHAFSACFGDSQFVLRLPSALSGTATTPVVYFLSRRMFGRSTATIATAIVAVSPALVAWDQQARGYSLGTLLVTSSVLALLRAIEAPGAGRWVAYTALVVVSIYTLPYAGLFVAAQWLALVFWPPARRQPLALAAVVAVLASAYTLLLVTMLRSGAGSVLEGNAAPSGIETVRFLQEFSAGLAPEFFGSTVVVAIITIVCRLVLGVGSHRARFSCPYRP